MKICGHCGQVNMYYNYWQGPLKVEETRRPTKQAQASYSALTCIWSFRLSSVPCIGRGVVGNAGHMFASTLHLQAQG